jgi:hypothetical protein
MVTSLVRISVWTSERAARGEYNVSNSATSLDFQPAGLAGSLPSPWLLQQDVKASAALRLQFPSSPPVIHFLQKLVWVSKFLKVRIKLV